MQPLTLARSWDSPHRGHVVVSSEPGAGRCTVSSSEDDALALEQGSGDAHQNSGRDDRDASRDEERIDRRRLSAQHVGEQHVLPSIGIAYIHGALPSGYNAPSMPGSIGISTSTPM